MGYILMQPDDSVEAKVATAKLLSTNKYDFDLALTGARLRPTLFNSGSCTATKNHYHGFVGEYCVADGQLVWKRGIFGVQIPSGFVT